jgi:hypothetical protein
MDIEEQGLMLVDVKQAAAALGMAPASLYSLARSGRVPSYSAGALGRGVRISITEAKAALRRKPQLNKEK